MTDTSRAEDEKYPEKDYHIVDPKNEIEAEDGSKWVVAQAILPDDGDRVVRYVGVNAEDPSVVVATEVLMHPVTSELVGRETKLSQAAEEAGIPDQVKHATELLAHRAQTQIYADQQVKMAEVLGGDQPEPEPDVIEGEINEDVPYTFVKDIESEDGKQQLGHLMLPGDDEPGRYAVKTKGEDNFFVFDYKIEGEGEDLTLAAVSETIGKFDKAALDPTLRDAAVRFTVSRGKTEIAQQKLADHREQQKGNFTRRMDPVDPTDELIDPALDDAEREEVIESYGAEMQERLEGPETFGEGLQAWATDHHGPEVHAAASRGMYSERDMNHGLDEILNAGESGHTTDAERTAAEAEEASMSRAKAILEGGPKKPGEGRGEEQDGPARQ